MIAFQNTMYVLILIILLSGLSGCGVPATSPLNETPHEYELRGDVWLDLGAVK